MRQALFADDPEDSLFAEMDEISASEQQEVLVFDRGRGYLGGFIEVSLRSAAEEGSTHPVGY